MYEDLRKVVNDTYKYFEDNNQKADFKFTAPMVTMLKGNVYENYMEQPPKEMVDRILNNPNTTPITKYYIQKCQETLGDFDPMDIDKNLGKLGLL